jgi:adenosylmethionine-8-amino-7-oxononanoate aminotransferase
MYEPTHKDLQHAARRHWLLNMTDHSAYCDGRRDLPVAVRGDGVFVELADGRRYIDGLSSLFCNHLGHAYAAELARVAAQQMQELSFAASWPSAHRPGIELAERLAQIAPPGVTRTFFTSGGSGSVESAWKIARQYHVLRGEPQRTKAIARRTAYHGLTLAALALTGDPVLKNVYGPPSIEVLHVSNTNRFRQPDGGDEAAFCARLLAEIEEAIEREGGDTIAAIFAEPIQNRGGCFTPPAGYWAGLGELADRHGILLVADEVISAFGRLGEWFGVFRYGGAPDIITCAKGLTSAHLPMGAVLVAEHIAEVVTAPGVTLNHGLTFGGHPVCAAVAAHNLEILKRDGILDHVRAETPHLRARLDELRDLPIVADIRGDGFFWAIELAGAGPDGRPTEEQRARLVRELIPDLLRDRGLLCRVHDRAEPLVQIAPPLISDRDVLGRIVDILADALAAASAELDTAISVLEGTRAATATR